jgi:hypothetical protein
MEVALMFWTRLGAPLLAMSLTGCTARDTTSRALPVDVGSVRKAVTGDLYISEVAHHPSLQYVQFVELCNPTNDPILLNNPGNPLGSYTLRRYHNSSAPENPGPQLEGVVEPGRTFLIVRASELNPQLGKQFQTEYGINADLSAPLAGAGGDAYELLRDGAPIDWYGTSGAGAGSPNWSYAKSSAERKSETTGARCSFRWVSRRCFLRVNG